MHDFSKMTIEELQTELVRANDYAANFGHDDVSGGIYASVANELMKRILAK